MRLFCWRERSEKLNWRLLAALDVAEVVRRGDPAALEPYALQITFARLPDPSTASGDRDAWFLVRVLQLAMEYLLFMRARDGDVLASLSQELRHVEQERDELVRATRKWKARARSGDKQVEKLHQVLQNIAKLLQIHGASPSAVATIETLLTELIAERRVRQKRRASVVEKDDEEGGEGMRPAVQEARVCGFCGKLFSAAEYLEKHLVRRHGAESVEVETPVKRKMPRGFEEEEVERKETNTKNEDAAASEAAMRKMVQQVERALREHEDKLRSLAEEEVHKVKQIYERLHAETKLAAEMKSTRLKTERQHGESQGQLEDLCLQKQKAESELADLKQQIQFLTLKKKMMGTAANVVLPTGVSPNSDDALFAAEAEIRSLQQTLEAVNAELTSAREELAKVQALHLSALRKKKELGDKLALSRGASAVVQQENSSQTEQPAMVNETVQTDEQSSPLLIESEMFTERCDKDVGTDPLFPSYEDAAVLTVDLVQESSIDAEAQASTIADPASVDAPASSPVVPEPISQGSQTGYASATTEVTAAPDDKRIPDYIQQIHSQDLLDSVTERAQSAASKVVLSDVPVEKRYSSISRRKYVRSRFQHDEDVVKERVASCLSQLEQFSRRFGVPSKCARLPESNLQLVQQALYGHLEVLPTEVLSRMVDCENAVSAIIEKEWVPMEKTRQQALERFKMEARAKSEISQGLVRQAMAAFGVSMKANQLNSEEVVAVNDERPLDTEEMPTERKLDEATAQGSTTDSKDGSVRTPARRYSAKNQLTVVVGGETTAEGTTYLAKDFEGRKLPSPNDDFAVGEIKAEEKANTSEVQETTDYLVENSHRDGEALNLEDKLIEPISNPDGGSISQPRQDAPSSASPSLGEPQATVATSLSGDPEIPDATETRFPVEVKTPEIKSIQVRMDTARDDRRRSSWETDGLARSHSGELSSPEPMSIEAQHVDSEQDGVEESRRADWQDENQEERVQWNLPRVSTSSDLEAPQPRISVHPVLSHTNSSHQPTDPLQSDRLAAASEFAVIEPVTGLDRTQSIVLSSEMSFGTSIPSLGDESESEEASTSVPVVIVDTVVERNMAEDDEASASSFNHAPAPTPEVQDDSVMSFDDSDIEEVMLT
ncbi:hypothetical protein PHYPSEUDO_009182 [Phytophthora pseudosyringae]|uniref:C2H2-type domain-containing protein n=1 Tax=Phytophthora pseudosyringae TaxID=221518 RepID=A0A8T1WCF9_9STRA|nr:hypothetical protein PHYPSEUDO_009182 [Phytophthora pseudosyringae]